MVGSEMTDLVQRVATLEADSRTYKEDITWMKKAVDSIKLKMARMETAFWVMLTIGQVGLYFLQSWLAR